MHCDIGARDYTELCHGENVCVGIVRGKKLPARNTAWANAIDVDDYCVNALVTAIKRHDVAHDRFRHGLRLAA